MSRITAPAHLDDDTRRWWARTVRAHSLGEEQRRILTLAGEAHDRCTSARKDLAANGGVTTKGAQGQTVEHPAVRVERQSRAAYAALIRQLGLDKKPPPSPAASFGRPRKVS